MLRIFLFIQVLAIVLLQPGPSVASGRLSDILDGIKKRYADLPGLTVTYTREVITRSMSMLGTEVKGDLATGHIYFKPPYFMRLEQETPKPETLASDGEILWWYIPDQKRAYEYLSSQFGQELRLLSDIFHGLMNVEDRFQVALLGRTSDRQDEIELRPNPPWESVDHITLEVGPGYEIRQVDIHNPLGSVTRFKLETIRVTDSFPKNFFQFKPPEGTEVIKEGS
jgi:outer membrane lipoprotein carrier protein